MKGGKSSSAKRADLTLAAAPLAASVGQSELYFPSFPAFPLQSLQQFLWERWASWAAEPNSIHHLIFQCLGISRILLRKLRDWIRLPRIQDFFSHEAWLEGEHVSKSWFDIRGNMKHGDVGHWLSIGRVLFFSASVFLYINDSKSCHTQEFLKICWWHSNSESVRYRMEKLAISPSCDRLCGMMQHPLPLALVKFYKQFVFHLQ